ncbi:hypothetical protein MBLNU230_g0088t1 [Neophaeotheca triangularis]
MASTDRPAPQTDGSFDRRNKQWLLPSNFRLRNLHSLSLRNLSFNPSSPTRQRRGTIDDDALPNSLVSPAKLVALREKKALGHSRSSSDLRRVPENAAQSESEYTDPQRANGGLKSSKAAGENGGPRTPTRPSLGKMRRRSTLEWANASPQTRQEKLEQVTSERLADVFFSLHVEGVKEPVYVSEVAEKTMNPTFRDVDLALCPPGVTRLDAVTVRIWAKTSSKEQWRYLLELSISMSELHYAGKSLDHIEQALPENTTLFHMPDGVYTSRRSLSANSARPALGAPAPSSIVRPLPTSSFDALLRLSKLDDSIQDAISIRNKIAADLEALLEANNNALVERDRVLEAEDRLTTIEYAKKTVEKQLEKARRQHSEKKASLRSRRKLAASDLEFRRQAAGAMRKSSDADELHTLSSSIVIRQTAVHSQRRRVVSDLQSVYSITPLANEPLNFRIRNLRLPNSEDLDSQPPEKVAGAFGYVAHLLQLLAFYLAQPLLYPVTPLGSRSTIEDPISLLKTNASTTASYRDDTTLRTYPLFPQGVPRFRFEYGVFLLNKNIQVLLEAAYDVRPTVLQDVRATLPNLKYLLYVATAGDGELPARKAGGVKGLLRANQYGAACDGEIPNGNGLDALSDMHRSRGRGSHGSAVESLRGVAGFKGRGKKT